MDIGATLPLGKTQNTSMKKAHIGTLPEERRKMWQNRDMG